MAGLDRYRKDLQKFRVINTVTGKALTKPFFVLSATDPGVGAALSAYAVWYQQAGGDPEYVSDVRKMVAEFHTYRLIHGEKRADMPYTPPTL